MYNRVDKEYLQDILEAVGRIKEYTSNMQYEEFLKDHRTQDALLRNIEIIGEAVKKISKDAKKKFPDIPWKEMAGTRDKLIHDYFGVNLDIVWGIIKNELDTAGNQIKSIIDQF